MWNFGLRVLIFLALFLAGLTWGWEFMLAGLIFAANTVGAKVEYLFLGFLYDLLLSFPLGFFTLASLAVLLVILASDHFFKETNFSSFSAKLLLASFFVIIFIFFYFLKSFWPELFPALRFAGLSFLKIFLFLAVFAPLFKIMESSHVRKIFAQ